MKKNTSSPQQMTAPQAKKNQRPENKDNIDSSEGEEQLTKGDDVTHNKKEQHNQPNRKKR